MASHFNNILLKRGLLAEFNESNPVLSSGQPAFAIDTNTLKIGNGVDRWADLKSFISTYDVKCIAQPVTIPSIDINQSETIVITLPGINLLDKYAIFVSPVSSLPDGLVVAYSYISNDNEVSVVIRNTSIDFVDAGSADGSGTVQSSEEQQNTLSVVAYLVEGTTTTTTTTTTQEPMVDNIQSFGFNEFGQLGTNDNAQKLEPYPVYQDKLWKAIDAGHYHSLAIDENDDLYSFGYNYYGQLGLGTNGTNNNKNIPYKISNNYIDNNLLSSGAKWDKVAAGTHHSLAIDTSGRLFSFGLNSYGSLGIGSTISKSVPTMVGDNTNYIAASAINIFDIINNKITFSGINASYSGDVKYILPSSGTYIISGVPQASSIAILNSGLSEYINYSGEYLGGSSILTGTTSDGLYKFYYGNIYIYVSGDFDKVSIHSESGGYIGGENLLYYSDPNSGWEDIAAGQHHSLGIKNGELYSFGQNTFGQLGIGNNIQQLSPVKVGNKSDWTKVIAGNYHSVAIDSTGVLWSFGKNDYGQLGLGDLNNRTSPTIISGVWESLSEFNFDNLASSGSLGIDVDDIKYIFNNTNGKAYEYQDRYLLTNGTYVISGVPSGYALALLNDGKQDYITYSGTNLLGSKAVVDSTNDGTYNFYYGTLTIQVSGDFEKISAYSYNSGYMGAENIFYYDRNSNTWNDASAGSDFTVALDTNNNLWSFGKNDYGQLGLGDTSLRNLPTKITGSNWQKVNAGANHVLAINNAKRLHAFGKNNNGQLGLGDLVDRYEPTTISTEIRWAKPAAGGNHSLASIYSYYPTAPQNLIINNAENSTLAGSKELELDWTHNTIFEEGITNFKIQISGTDITPFFVTKPVSIDTMYIVTNLINGSGYKARVASVNSVAEVYGPWYSTDVQPTEAIDEQFCDYVRFLSHFDGDNNSTTFTDLSQYNWSGYAVGSAKITNNQYKFGNSSALLDNAGGITFGSGSNLNLDGNFTIECFAYPSCWNNDDQTIINSNNFSSSDVADSGWSIMVSGGIVKVKHNLGGITTTLLTSTGTLPLNQWSHIAWARSGTKHSLFINGYKGVSDSTTDIAHIYNNSGINIGANIINGNLSKTFWGYIDEARISENIRYSGVYTIPSRSFGIDIC